jgi:hypothetical protein
MTGREGLSMLQYSWESRIRGAAFGGAIGLTMLACGSAALAQDAVQNALENNVIVRTERQIWGAITRGFGLRGADDEVIEYRERSPLVVPPTRDLPPPRANPVTANPAWPVDPDAQRAKQRADAKKKRLSSGAGFQDADTLGNAISPTELNAPGTAASSRAPAGDGRTFDPRDGRPLTPGELGFSGFTSRAFGFGQNSQEVGTFTGEPPRASLTAPPRGYQTPSPAYPYGMTGAHEQPKSAPVDQAVGQY